MSSPAPARNSAALNAATGMPGVPHAPRSRMVGVGMSTELMVSSPDVMACDYQSDITFIRARRAPGVAGPGIRLVAGRIPEGVQPFASACSRSAAPLNTSWSTGPGTPGVLPLLVYCQNV
ncbi:hypothetical protein GCM10009754_27650 [Amycolatopsis minnesotensis]|uniref:Uncharacterized protein n=1 Tax=Amycolatopsis minnesotensis TaxID=337894 RepID=A0ABP5C4Z2_9PSEU